MPDSHKHNNYIKCFGFSFFFLSYLFCFVFFCAFFALFFPLVLQRVHDQGAQINKHFTPLTLRTPNEDKTQRKSENSKPRKFSHSVKKGCLLCLRTQIKLSLQYQNTHNENYPTLVTLHRKAVKAHLHKTFFFSSSKNNFKSQASMADDNSSVKIEHKETIQFSNNDSKTIENGRNDMQKENNDNNENNSIHSNNNNNNNNNITQNTKNKNNYRSNKNSKYNGNRKHSNNNRNLLRRNASNKRKKHEKHNKHGNNRNHRMSLEQMELRLYL